MSNALHHWHAKLALSFSRQGPDKTILSGRRHEGPLMVQKALYPEGSGVCHVTILHPPSGIAGGDMLSIDAALATGSHAVLSTPGATRWYKSNGRHAEQRASLHLAANARLDWLPQENIFFEQTQAACRTHMHLASGARMIGWEITQLGSIDRASHWDAGRIFLDTKIFLDGALIWLDANELEAASALRHSCSGLAGFPVMATLWAFGPQLDATQVEEFGARATWTDALRAGFTHMPQKSNQGLSLLRVLGTHVQDVRQLLIDIWMQLRPLVIGSPGQALRIWNT